MTDLIVVPQQSQWHKLKALVLDHGRTDRILRPKEHVQFRMQRVAQEQLNNNLLRADLGGELPQAPLVVVCGRAEC